MGRVGFVPTPDPYRTGLNSTDDPPRPLWQWPLAVLGCLLAVYLVVVGLFWWSSDDLAFMTHAIPTRDEPIGGTEKIWFDTPDGVRLFAYWRKPRAGMPVIVTFPGYESPRHPANRFSDGPWLTEGWGLLSVALRGYPGSTGTATEGGVEIDAEAAREFVGRHAAGAPVVYHGHGIGAAVAVRMAELHPAHGLYLDGPFTSLRDLAAFHFPYLPTILVRAFPNVRRLPFVQCPILVTRWLDDPIVPPELSERLAATNPDAVLASAPGGWQVLGRSPVDAQARDMFRPRRAP